MQAIEQAIAHEKAAMSWGQGLKTALRKWLMDGSPAGAVAGDARQPGGASPWGPPWNHPSTHTTRTRRTTRTAHTPIW